MVDLTELFKDFPNFKIWKRVFKTFYFIIRDNGYAMILEVKLVLRFNFLIY